MTSGVLTMPKSDHMTTGGQIIVRRHNEALPPATFGIDITVMAMRVSRSHPYRMGVWRLFPPSRLPTVGIAVPVTVSRHPDVISAWTRRAVFADTDRGPELYHDLRMRGYYPKGKAKQRGKNQFSHFLLRCLCKQVYGRDGFLLFHRQKGPTI